MEQVVSVYTKDGDNNFLQNIDTYCLDCVTFQKTKVVTKITHDFPLVFRLSSKTKQLAKLSDTPEYIQDFCCISSK